MLRAPQVEVHKQRDLCRVEREDGEYGGYRKDILKENLSEREKLLLICEICKGIMREASMSSSGEQFCSSCNVGITSSASNVTLRKTISSLKCCCPLMRRGCVWLGTLKDCENHLVTCDCVGDECRLGCGKALQRKKLKFHENENCPLRNVRCKLCDKESISCKLPTHLEMCPRMKVSCELCGIVMYREDMTQHLEVDCVEKKIECPFAKYRCEVGLIKRKYLSQHLKERETKHLGLELSAMGLKLTAMELKLIAVEELVMKQSEIIEKLNSKSPK